MLVSVVVPLHNSNETIEEFYRDLKRCIPEGSEIIFVDNGSTDGTMNILGTLAREDGLIKVIGLSHEYGMSSVLRAGFAQAREEWVVTMRADLQSDPMDIVRMIEAAESGGYDAVAGWRKTRREPFFSCRLPEALANAAISFFTGVRLHDYACPLHIYRNEYLQKLPLRGETYRFIPACFIWNNARVAEVGIQQRPGIKACAGDGFSRMGAVILDIVIAKYGTSHTARPMRVFSAAGCTALAAGVAAMVAGVYGMLAARAGTPYLWLAGLFFIGAAWAAFLGGFIAELLARIYAESRDQTTYQVRKKINY